MPQPLRIIFDTNIYELLYKKDKARVLGLVEAGRIIVYGCKIIRNELREIPPSVKVDGKSYRVSLLFIYDNLTEGHSYPAEDLAGFLAEEYWNEYKGGVSKHKMFSDFQIVAISSIHGLDIIVSGDEHTMKSRQALQAYNKVNLRNGLRTPEFITLEELRP